MQFNMLWKEQVMGQRLWKSVFLALVIAFIVLPIIEKVSADCDMWAWITTEAATLSTSGQNAYKESVKWYRWVSKGLDGDAICDDGWSIWGHSTEVDSINWRRQGAPYAKQVYDQNWNNQRDGMDFTWAPNIPEGGNAYHLDFAMSHSRASGSNVNYNDPHPFIYSLGGRDLAMQHNGLLLSNFQAPMQTLIGAGYWNMSMFVERQYNGQHSPSPLNDSELYAMLLMKNVLLADNYGEDDLWAIKKTINQIIGSVSYSSLNIYFINGEEIYAASKSSSSTYAADHRIWYAYNNVNNRQYACIVTGNLTPGYSPTTWNYWTPATEVLNGNWYKIDKNLLYPASGSLTPVADPWVCEYAYDGRNPMVGNDAAVAAGPGKDYVVVWGTNGNIYYNYFDQMGLCERVPIQLNPSGMNYQNPDVVFDGGAVTSPYYNHFYVVCERGLPEQPANEICLLEMSYNSASKTWTPGTPIVVNQNNSQVANPAVAWGGGKLVVTWQQTLPGTADWHIRTAAYLSGGSMSMSDRLVGEATLTEQRVRPDVLYIDSQSNPDPHFLPAGPDNYGYLAYESCDIPELPIYDWIEISADSGGNGTLVPFVNDDQVFQYHLSFDFQYYGIDYNTISIATNGWVAMGRVRVEDYSNSGIPNADGPPRMIAAYWEDLSPQRTNSGKVWYWYDIANHRYIVEYNHIEQYAPVGNFETFQVILYDPAYYPTITGDGRIKVQYKNMSTAAQSEGTIGIENPDETTGIQIFFDGLYNAHNFPITNGTAILYTIPTTVPAISEPIFIISYLQKDLVGGNHGVYVSRIITNPAPSSFTGDEAYAIVQNPDHTMPALALADESDGNHIVCAFRESPGTTSHQIVALRMVSPLEDYPSTWYNPEEVAVTATNSFTPASDIDPHFFEVDVAGRDNGNVDVVFTDYDDSGIPAQYLINCIQYACPFNAGADVYQIDADASIEDMDPVLAIANWQGVLQRLIVWSGYISSFSEPRLVANFDPPHFGAAQTDWLAESRTVPGKVEPPSNYIFNSVYPNPFNPVATLTFVLPEACWVKLEVYDILGRNVNVQLTVPLPNGMMSSGSHSVIFDGSRLASGVYFARLQAGNWSAVQKMVLVK
jgi:hypothetical protein